MLRRSIILGLTLVSLGLAGCASDPSSEPEHVHHHAVLVDTGLIEPGDEVTLSFELGEGGAEIHCHPHPFMTQRILFAVDGATEAHVHIFDGDSNAEYRFEPAELTLGAHAHVTYHNHGTWPHTATQIAP